MFLGVTATVTNWDAEGTSCSFVLEDNPLVDFVELPDTCQGLQYCNVLSGVIRGALEMVSFSVFAIQVLSFYSSFQSYF
jgi:trafficking protein particle complex subunit 3